MIYIEKTKNDAQCDHCLSFYYPSGSFFHVEGKIPRHIKQMDGHGTSFY
jgi:hypothetical protein